MSAVTGGWDPLLTLGSVKHTQSTLIRIKKDIQAFYETKPEGIMIYPDEDDMTLVHAYIEGPSETPYAGGCFYFVISFPHDYPWKPLKARIMNTCGGTVRFNPNLYQNGKVCLSILGTWEGPSWSPALTLSSVLISMQSLLCENPFYNEPAYGGKQMKTQSDRYNEVIEYETIRVAICEMLEAPTCTFVKGTPYKSGVAEKYRPQLQKVFMENYQRLIKICELKLNAKMIDETARPKGRFNYQDLKARLQKIHDGIVAKQNK